MSNIYNILSFDTSNSTISVGVSRGAKILAYNEELKPSMQAEKLIPMIESTLNEAKLNYKDMDYLGVVNGPGSFTGIRVGLSCAKAICFAQEQIKCITVSNFDMSHFRAKEQIKTYEKIYVILDAYRSQLYIQSFDRSGSKSNPLLIDYDQTIEILNNNPKHHIIACAGNGLEYIQDLKIPNLIILPRFRRIKAVHICKYVHQHLLRSSNIKFDNIAINPLYIRPSDAKPPNLK
ncbi:MAG: tRNA (adenosine(37)-N6)-threonylcarbamoyltransferase complex dimerization subunit type 1 TsaB [Rickettsiaceae bacterium]